MLEIISGWEPREAVGYQACMQSAIKRTSQPIRFIPLIETALHAQGLYSRPHQRRGAQLWDIISGAPMATSFACSRFLTPWLSSEPWALFCDFADMLFLTDPAELLALADDRYATMVVKHRHTPVETVKMDGQIQTAYARKNWSSVILWNRRHPANRRLTVEMVNSLPGRDLHRFCWLKDDEIGDLPIEWNWLVGVKQREPAYDADPKLLHFTLGIPTMPGYENGPYSAVWHSELENA
jgi:hypothetical protein